MAPEPPVANVVRATIYTAVGEDIAAGTNFELSYSGSPPSPADCTAIAGSVNGFYVGAFTPYVSNEADMVGCAVRDLSSDIGAVGSVTVSISGDMPGSPLPVGVAVVLSKHIARHYRGGHPRNYLVLGTTSALAGASRFGGGFVANVQTAAEAFMYELPGIASGATTITGLVAVSYRAGGAARLVPLVQTVTGLSVSPIPGSQRKRYQR
jgi:hypothetical protein